MTLLGLTGCAKEPAPSQDGSRPDSLVGTWVEWWKDCERATVDIRLIDPQQLRYRLQLGSASCTLELAGLGDFGGTLPYSINCPTSHTARTQITLYQNINYPNTATLDFMRHDVHSEGRRISLKRCTNRSDPHPLDWLIKRGL